MYGIEEFWTRRLSGAVAMNASKLDGWLCDVSSLPGFVEPHLSRVEGDPETARMLIIAAPGAVGKSVYAKALAEGTNAVIVDLAKTSPVGGYFFTGGLAKAFDDDALSAAKKGNLALVIDALDEAQMRAGSEGYEAGLLDLADIASIPTALPTVLLGRGIAAEDAYVLLNAKGHDACLLKIEFFTEEQASAYLRKKLPILAERAPKVASAYNAHDDVFHDLAEQARGKLIDLAGPEQTHFAGYAPVLDAICEFTLDEDGGLNPKAKMANLKAANQIDLIDDIATSILEREQGKVQGQFREKHPEASTVTVERIYTVEEQLQRVAYKLFGGTEPPLPELPNETYYETYQEMAGRFSQMHPFMEQHGEAANPVFSAYVVAWALKKSGQAPVVRKAVQAKPSLLSGTVFDLYQRHLLSGPNPFMPLADVGLLYQALNSQLTPGQRVQLEVSDQDGGEGTALDVSFEILEPIDTKTGEAAAGRTWGPFSSSAATELKLHSPFSNVYVTGEKIMVELGDGIIQQIGAPTELNVEWLFVSANKVLVHGGASGQSDLQTVTLIAKETECDGIQKVIVRDATLSVFWPKADAYPWTNYVVKVPPAADENVEFMRRRLRRILTAFRSHSKGALVRIAAKIDHQRMIKDDRGRALVDKLIADNILVLRESHKFYRLNQDIMAAKWGIGYHDLAQSRFTPTLDSYLTEVAGSIRRGRCG